MTSERPSAEGTALAPIYCEGPTEVIGDVHLHQRFFTCQVDAGLISGKTFNVMFTLDRPAREVWPYLKDPNLWQNSYGYYYSGVVGDLEGKTFRLSGTPNEDGPHQYNVVRVIPEHVIVVMQPLADEDRAGGLSPDCHVFMLNEHDGRTVITILMEHASLSKDKTEEGALEGWREVALESQRKWRDSFIPTLKKLVDEA